MEQDITEEVDITEFSKKMLKERIALTRQLLTDLEDELERRELNKQHDSVEDMEEHFNKTDASILNLTGIIREFLKDKK